MNVAARQEYLTTEVLTAAPQKLQLLLVEAAIRHVHAAREHTLADRHEAAGDALVRAQGIVSELLAGIHPERRDALTRKVAGVYVFLHRTLVEAHLRRDATQLDAALKILAEERETWRQVCEQLGTRRAADDSPSGGFTA